MVMRIILLPALFAIATSVGSAQDRITFRDSTSLWPHWGDGKAELSGYRLTIPRYGAPREGTAVAIFVTEDFLEGSRVKAESPGDKGSFPAIKLNLIQDFQAGLYDYNMMTSTFVGLQPSGGRPVGAISKVSFGSQEWCGHVYDQLLFDARSVRQTTHSYFEGEADDKKNIAKPGNGISADALLLWARGLSQPLIDPGGSKSVKLLDRLQDARLKHHAVRWRDATLSRSSDPQQVTVPAGTFEADTCRVDIEGEGNPHWIIWVEHAPPHRVLRWILPSGESAELLGSTRLAYWKLNGPGMRSELHKLGFKR
jgi:hypothetical protein